MIYWGPDRYQAGWRTKEAKPCHQTTWARRQKGKVVKMNQIELIKDLQQKGMGPSEIAGRLKLDRKTVSKYMKHEDYSPVQPIKNTIRLSLTSGNR